MRDPGLRYVTARKNSSGGVRYYWQRRSFPVTRLPDDPVERYARALRLNTDADGGARAEDNTVSYVIEEYRLSEKYDALAIGSKRHYEHWLNHFEKHWGHFPIAGITRKPVLELKKSLRDRPGRQRMALAVLNNLFIVAINHELITSNPAKNLDIKASSKRLVIWPEAAMDEFEVEAYRRERGLCLAFQLLRYTGQRSSDVSKMVWTQYDGERIRLRQQKTGTLLDVPCPAKLNEILAQASRRSALIATTRTGRPWNTNLLHTKSMRIRRKLGLEKYQLRDLRRTAAVNLAEAGATLPEIAAVTGHSLSTLRVLERYVPVNREMAEAGIAKLERRNREQSLTR